MSQHTLATAAGQLRSSALVRGRGWPQLLKIASPAAGQNWTRPVPADFWERILSVAFTLTTSATVAFRSVAFNLLDGDGNIWNQTQLAFNVPAGVTLAEYGDLATTSNVQGEQSANAAGSVTSPAANAAIANLSSLAAGTYLVTAIVTMAGTLAQAVDANNIKLTNGGITNYANLENGIGAAPQTFGPFEIDVPAGGSIVAAVTNLATVGAIYSAELIATPVGQQSAFTLPDLVLKSAWQIQAAVGNIQAADQISSIFLLVERYPTSDLDIGHLHLADELAGVILGHLGG